MRTPYGPYREITDEDLKRHNCKHPYVYPNGDCVDCGVLATTFPGHCEHIHMMVARPAQILTFFAGTRPDDKGRYLGAIQNWSDRDLEGCHDQIQWMFPAPERSRYNPKAPLLTQDVIDRFSSVMRFNLRFNFLRMMKFYSFQVEEAPLRIRATNLFLVDESELPYWLNPKDHNLLRLTRIIRSLKLLGLEAESLALFKCLSEIYTWESGKESPRLERETFDWWKKAATCGLEDFK